MKTNIFIAAGVVIIASAIYIWRSQKKTPQASVPEKENERHHLTNIFSRAKQVAIRN